MQLHNKNSQALNAVTKITLANARVGNQRAAENSKLRGQAMPNKIFAIYDNVADSIIGGLHLHPHHAPAIRMFGDVATLPNSSIGLHPEDFDLLLLGVLNEDHTITPCKEIILAGATWAAAQKPHLAKEA